jgi:hypothetical protein
MVKRIILILVILGVIFMIYRSQLLYRQYKSHALEGIEGTNNIKDTIITKKDIEHLPEPVQNYLKYVGVLGTERVKNYKVTIDGSMKTDKERDWANVEVKQHSFTDEITRLFFMKLKMFGIPVVGLHSYINENASMLIKVLGLVPVVDGQGKEMNQGETVTVFNDMCILAPATLIDKRIEWESIDSLTAKAKFTNGDIKISATLYFNEKGQLINFVSDDRFYSPTGKTYEKVRWSTPVSDYKNINGFNLATYGEAIWNFPNEDFTYIKLNIKDVRYNVEELK